jgi:hypothetical protein
MYRSATAILVAAAVLCGCSSGNSGSGGSAAPSGNGIFSLQSQSAAPGGEARVSLRPSDTAGSIVTVISELDYDTAQMQMKKCELSASNASTGKALQVAEPSPGVVRAVLAGDLAPVPLGADLITCTFAVPSNAAKGTVAVHAHGEVSDTTFEDRSFTVEGTVVIGD